MTFNCDLDLESACLRLVHENLSKSSGDMEQTRKRRMTFNCDLDLESALLSYRFYTSSH